MANVDLVKLDRVAPFRKVAIGTWATTYDPTVYGTMRIRMEEAEAYIAAFRAQTGKRLTVTHLVTAAVARALKKCPEANAIIRWNKIYLRQQVDVSVLVVVPSEDGSKVDLSAAVLREADTMTLADQIDALDAQVGGIRTGADKAMKKAKSDIMKVPFLAMNAFLKLISFLLYDLNLDLRGFGFPKDPFGGATVTNVGSLGLDIAYVPLVPYTRVPIFVAPGVVRDEAVVDGDKVVPGRVMYVNASFDHRFIDGYHAMVLSKTLHEVLADPWTHLDPLARPT
jgi:pyruvate/2-oxoglutarate dehydrogenase complex dihydrolipoamide acyltransferase (E2) component